MAIWGWFDTARRYLTLSPNKLLNKRVFGRAANTPGFMALMTKSSITQVRSPKEEAASCSQSHAHASAAALVF